MKKIFLIVLSVLSLTIASGQSVFDTVVAQVKLTKTELIKLSYVEEKLDAAEKQVGRPFTVEEKDFILDSIINNEIIKQAAARDGINVTEDMILNMLRQQAGGNASDQQIKDAVVAQYKSSWEDVSKALIEQLSLQEYIKIAGAEELKKYAVPPTQEEIVEFYNNNKTKFVNPDMVRVNHIFFSTQGKDDKGVQEAKKKADDALLLIKKGSKTFDELVQEVSEDRNSALNGGELGFIARDDANTVQLLGTEFINTVFNLPMDKIHGVYKSNSGYHIVEITEKRSARLLKLTDPINPSTPATVAQYIQQSLGQQKSTQAFAQVTEIVIQRLRKEAVIKVMDKSIPWK
ncbi:peptidylprolyl isomerase [Thiospirochaeta perfilievii]|nr:peptidylprolyl isomerase [Thiospirochaeta perfilievii]